MTNEEAFRLRSCDGKKQYPDHRIAREAAGAMMRKLGGKFDEYRCAFCQGWHITSKRTSGDQRKRYRAAARGGR